MLIRITAENRHHLTEQNVYISGDHRTLESLRELFLTNTVVKQNSLNFKVEEVISCRKCGKSGTTICPTCPESCLKCHSLKIDEQGYYCSHEKIQTRFYSHDVKYNQPYNNCKHYLRVSK